MYHTLLHIYGPFSIHSFGLMIALGLFIFTWLLKKDPACKALVSEETLLDTLIVGIFTATIGGRLLYCLSSPPMLHGTDYIKIWDGGFSILGTIIATLCSLPFFLRSRHVPAGTFIDVVVVYAPLLQSISRIGCFLAGCCYGSISSMPWSIGLPSDGSDGSTNASLVFLHPSQLYSSLFLFLIFLCMYYVVRPRVTRQGQATAIYVFLTSIERFTVDFFRGDQDYFSSTALHIFSIHQWIALGLIVGSLGALIYLQRPQPHRASAQ